MKPENREQVAQTIHAARETWHASRRSICGSGHDEHGRTLNQAIADAAADAIFTAVLPEAEVTLDVLIECARQYQRRITNWQHTSSPGDDRAMQEAEASMRAARARVLAAVKGDG